MDNQFDFDLDAEIARTRKALEELELENERNGTNEAIRRLCEEQRQATDKYFAEMEREDRERSKKALESST